MLFFGGLCGKLWNVGTEKQSYAVSRAWWTILVGAWKTVMLRAMMTMKAHPAQEVLDNISN